MFSDRLKLLRKSNGYTQQQIANILHIQRSTYSYYENGKTRPDFETLVKLSLIFSTDIEELLEHEEEAILADKNFFKKLVNVTAKNGSYALNLVKKNVDSKAIFQNDFLNLSANEKNLLYLYRKLSSEEKKKVLEFCYASAGDI